MVIDIVFTDMEGNYLSVQTRKDYADFLVPIIGMEHYAGYIESGFQIHFDMMTDINKSSNLLAHLSVFTKSHPNILISLSAPYQELGFMVYFANGRHQIAKSIRAYEPINLTYLMGLDGE